MSISSYILSVVGVVFLGVMVDVILPEGQMNKFVKGAFSLIALFVVLSPGVALLNNGFSINQVFEDSTTIEADSDFVEATQKQMKAELENGLYSRLVSAGFSDIKVEILCEMSNSGLEIKKVILDISKMVINTNLPHINKYTEIKNVVTDYLNVEESDVVINE